MQRKCLTLLLQLALKTPVSTIFLNDGETEQENITGTEGNIVSYNLAFINPSVTEF